VYCDHCQTTAVDGAKFCPFCGGKLTEAPADDAAALADAPTVALTVGPCESCGAPSLPGSTLCLPCTRAFESILGTQTPAPVLPVAAAPVSTSTPQAPVLPSAPGQVHSAEAATVLAPATAAAAHDDEDEEPLADDEEYEDEPDELMAEEAATVLMTAPPAAPEEPAAPLFSSAPATDWSTPSTSEGDQEAIVAIAPWARKGPDAEVEPEPTPATEPTGPEPTPWWERNGQQSPTAAAKPEVARYVPPPSVTPPPSASLESTLARQAMRPKSAPLALPVVARQSANRSRTLLIAAALAGVAAIGTPVMWKFAFASRPETVSAFQPEPAAAPEPASPRPDRVHGSATAAASTPAAPRVYQDLQPPDPAPAPAPAATTHAAAHAAPKPSVTKKPGTVAAPEPTPAPAAPEPAPLAASAPPPVVAAPVVAAPPPPAATPAPVQAEAVPLGQIYEVSQVESRPSVTRSFEPVLPARLAGRAPVVVIVRVLVSPGGRAVESSAVKNPTNDDGLSAAAAATVRQWTFAPAKKKGQPVSCWINVGVVFKAASGD
jgi:protein TonB